MSEWKLPAAEPQNPSCGACRCETTFDDGFACFDCGLIFDGDYLDASYIDEDAEPCGHPCGNYWHGPDLIKPGWSYACHPCALPTGHTSDHWTPCEPVSTLNLGSSVAADKGGES